MFPETQLTKVSMTDEENLRMDLSAGKLRFEKSDKEQYSNYKTILGKDAPESFEKFQDIKYNVNQEGYEDLKGLAQYVRQNPGSDKKYYEINKAIKGLVADGLIDSTIGTAVKPVPDTIASVGKHGALRLQQRGITFLEAQSYIDNAVVMFNQSNGKRHMYYSENGAAGIMTTQKQLITAFPENCYDPGGKKIIEVSTK